MNWLKENWFKLALVIIALGFLLVYFYDTKQKYEPKNLKEKIEQNLIKN